MHHHVNQDEFLTSMISIISKIIVQIKKNILMVYYSQIRKNCNIKWYKIHKTLRQTKEDWNFSISRE